MRAAGTTSSLAGEPQLQQRAAFDEIRTTDSLPTWVVPNIDEQRMRVFGISGYRGSHLTLYTDLPETGAIAELPVVFDAAVPQWCSYFEIPAERAAKWHMTAYLMKDKARFHRAGVLPGNLPPFLHGYQRDAELWLYEQPGDYYRRHLLLHEGTHAFMEWSLGAKGPPWYSEGMAELLATHLWDQGQLKLRHFPQDRNEVPHWGRIKILREDLAAGRDKSLEDVLRYDEAAHVQVEPYAWCWAAATLFDTDPSSRMEFRGMRHFTSEPSDQFTQRFHQRLKPEWSRLARQWQVLTADIDYGYSLDRELVEYRPVSPLPGAGASLSLATDQGWQSSGFDLEAGTKYRLEASGRYQIANQPDIWWCEPNGVTIRYARGFPLGMLLGAIVVDTAPPQELSSLVRPVPIGLSCELTPDLGGTLYLRVNDLPSELDDNVGQLTVRITAGRNEQPSGGKERGSPN